MGYSSLLILIIDSELSVLEKFVVPHTRIWETLLILKIIMILIQIIFLENPKKAEGKKGLTALSKPRKR